jgi:hypothetical protein
MRKRMLQGLQLLFRRYIPFVAVVWLALILIDVFLAVVVFPSPRGGLWSGIAGTTVGCLIGMVFIGILKSLFHGRVARALDEEKGSHA